jgi:hypothetical protein
MLVAFAVMLLSPIAANASVADQVNSQAESLAQATETPPEVTEEPLAEETEEPVIEETEVPLPTEEPVNELLGSIEIDYWECDAGYDIMNADLENLFQDCAGVDGVEFTVNTSDGGTASQLTGEFGDSHVSFTELPTGATTIAQVNPPGDIYVICNGIVQHGGPETGDTLLVVNANENSVLWNLLDDEIVFCSWIIVPEMDGTEVATETATEVPGTETATETPGTETATETPDGEGNSVTVYKWDCPEDTAYGMSIDEYSAACDTEHLNIPITLTDANGDRATTTQANGTQWDDVVPEDGAIHIAEQIPDGYGDPVVFCAPLDVDTFSLVPSAGGMVSLTEFGQDTPWSLQCNWYNIPGHDNTVTVYKWDCPEGTQYGQDMDYYGAECATEHLNIPISLVDANGEHATTTQANGTQWNNVTIGQEGELQIIEEIPDGYGDPVVYCWTNDGDPALVESANGFVVPKPASEDGHFDYYCNWYNIPENGSSITITKYECPEGTTYDHDDGWYQENCTAYHEGIDFKLTHSEGVEFDTTGADGMAGWGDVPLGPFSIQEHLPYEYDEPVVICGFTAMVDGAILDGFPQRVESPGGYVEFEFEYPGTDYFCDWYNIPGGPGEITIYKYTCPEGYDLYAWDANPTEDCTEKTDGIEYTLVDEDPGTVDLQSSTGDAIDGAVNFGSLAPGPYTVIETVPADTEYVFVLDCYGQDRGALRPYPLSMGDTLDINVGAGESIECYWYNVPGYDPDYGRITVYKYECSTKTYVSDVDCEVYEDGQGFDLVQWDGDSWEYVDTKTTDGAGKAMWINVESGEYWLDEHDGDRCHIASEQMSDDGNWINVYDNQETVVRVYNCSDTPGKPGKTPTKYPNTGVPSIVEPWRETP